MVSLLNFIWSELNSCDMYHIIEAHESAPDVGNEGKKPVVIRVEALTDYSRELILQQLRSHTSSGLWVVEDGNPDAEGDAYPQGVLWAPHRRIPWSAVANGRCFASHMLGRAGLVRKSRMFLTLQGYWRKKGPMSAVPETFVAEWTKDGDEECEREDWSTLCKRVIQKRGGLWTLKPGASSNAAGMRIIDSACAATAYIESQVERRSWVLQSYIHPPMTLNGRKFHIRVMVLAVGRLKVYVHEDPAILCAGKVYNGAPLSDLAAHASNHSIADRLGCSLPAQVLSAVDAIPGRDLIFSDICRVVEGLFTACVETPGAMMALPNTFELYGLDFMLSDDGRLWLLEANADPDIGVFGEQQKSTACRIISGILDLAIIPFLRKEVPIQPKDWSLVMDTGAEVP